jgi:uncharacterized protein (TIGR02246 family)
MRTIPRIPLLLLSLLACSLEKAPPTRTASAANPSAEIAAFWDQYIAAEKAADTAAWQALLTEDVTFVFTGGETIRGRARAAAFLSAWLAQNKIAAIHISSEEVTVSGDHAFQLARVHEAYQPNAGPTTEQFSRMGAFLLQTGSGRWLLDRAVVIIDSTVTR